MLIILVLAVLTAIAWGMYLLARSLTRRAIWRLRNRLMVTYVFVGLVPVLLFFALAFSGMWLLTGEIAIYLVNSELSRKAASLESPTRFLSEIPAERRPMLAGQLAPLLAAWNPGFSIAVRGPVNYHYPEHKPAPEIPDSWSNFTGVVERDGLYYCVSVVTSGDTTAAIIAPLTAPVMQALVPGIGVVSFYKEGVGARNHFMGAVPEQRNALDFEATWKEDNVNIASWQDLKREPEVNISIDTRPSAVLSTLLAGREGGEYIFLGLAVLLGMVELIAVVITTSLTRTITGAVHQLYTGTQQIAHGDFSHRIAAKGQDQLADLGKSFNQMSEQLEKLVVVAKEKERLQSELTIACEVQNQLFPRTPPPMRTIKLIGSCEPARSVSGDYYDYICLPNGNLAFAIGDVAGKGISAALLMASIQSIMRTQLAGGTPSPGQLVAQLNRQLHENTAPEKYATFFFALYEENSRMLTYTNAGHLAPLIICGNEVKQLEPTGTVVGLFPVAHYAEATIALHHDDLLLAYTDGITEPENAYGEEFGTERLAEVVLRNRSCEPAEIVAKVMEAVKHWSHSPELPDDMTGADRAGNRMKVLTPEQMGAVDQATIDAGIPSVILMENAAHRCVEYLAEKFSPLSEQRIVVVCGKGNNGGDGLAIARQLHVRFAPRRMWVVVTPDATQDLAMLYACGVQEYREFGPEMHSATLVIDAVLGTGLKGAARGPALDAIREINGSFPYAKIFSVDIPSGLSGDSGAVPGEYVRADATVTFTALKVCHAMPPACGLMGDLRVTQIGSPASLYNDTSLELISPDMIQRLFAPRVRNSNKGLYGHVLIVAGSKGKSGAAAMAGLAALRAGAGLVTVACPESALAAVAAHAPELMTEPLAETADGVISKAALPCIEELASTRSVVAIGPGIGTHYETREVVLSLFHNLRKPMVLDADALNCLAVSEWSGSDSLRVLTPHPGEMKRLIKSDIEDRLAATRSFSDERRVTLVLKGDGTLIGFPDGRVWINPTGSPAMSTGGTGDILTGMIAGLVAQFPRDPDTAVAAAVYLHGLTGEIGERDLTEQCLIATDLLRYLPEAIRAIANVPHRD